MKRRVPFLELNPMPQHLGEELKQKFAEMLAEGVFSAGKEVDVLESRVAHLLGLPNAIACSNGTEDRKITRLNSSHVKISYAVFCLKKKKIWELAQETIIRTL